MAASSLLTMSTQAVFAAYRQVQTTANNISNANVEGYSRQTVQLATAGSEFTGGGWIGRGVTTTTVARASNAFLTDQSNALASAAGTDAVRSTLLDQLQQAFGKTDSGLGAAATLMFGAFADLAAAPADLSARQSVLGRLDDFASLARSTDANLNTLADQVRNDIRNSVEEVNGMARALARLNVQIVNASAMGHEPNDLLDQRDQLVRQLATQLEVHTVTGTDGNMAVYLGNGQTLVLGANSNQLTTVKDAMDPSRLTLGVKIDGGLTLLSSSVEGEGRIAGLFRVQNHDLPDARGRLGQMVAAIAGALNRQQGLGLDLTGAAGAPLFDVPAPRAIPASTNPLDASGQPLANLSLAVTDPAALEPSDYTLSVDAGNPGNWTLTRLADGLVRTGIAPGTEVDGLRIDVGLPPPSGGERFLLRSVSESAGGISLSLRSPQGLAAANPISASADVQNLGTVGVAAVAVREPSAGGYAALSIAFTDDAGSYEVRDSGGAVLSTGVYDAAAPLSHDGLELTLSGVPRSGDLLHLQPTVHVANGNGNALSLQGWGGAALIGGQSVADAYASLLSDVGVRAQSAQTSAGNSSTALSHIDTQLRGETGVNLDEEAAKLIQHQQSYQAAAKMLQTAQTLLDTVIQLVR